MTNALNKKNRKSMGRCLWLPLICCLAICSSAEDARKIGYLVDQTRGVIGSPVAILSSWDVHGGGHLTNGWGGLQIIDNSNTNGVTMSRPFYRQSSGVVTMEFRFNVSARVNGLTWQLRDGDKPAVKVITSGGNLCYTTSSGSTVTLAPYAANTEVGVKVVVDVTQKSTDIYVDGVLRVSGAPFASSAANALDTVFINTGTTGTCTLYQRGLYIYRGYAVNERFLAQKEGSIPADWTASTTGGSVSVVRNIEIAGEPDCNSAKLTDTSNASSVLLAKTFARQSGRTEFEFNFALPTKQDGFQARLLCNGKTAATFLTQGGHLCYRNSNGTSVPVWRNYVANVFYSVRMTFTPATGLADIMLNDIPMVSNVAMSATSNSYVDKLEFETSATGTGVVWVDDILVYPFQEYAADYVPAPISVAHGSNLIGLQVCNLWREGFHIGWDWISNCADRSPIIGFYDEGNPEAMDWQIKFLVDHGVDFVMPCWYRPSGAKTGVGPMKEDGYARGLNAMRRAKYADAMRYALIIETANAPLKSLSDWRDTVVPFLVEHYFRDPRYLIVDNKPVVGFFGGIKGAGDAEVARTALRNACVQAGFAGVTMIGCKTTGDSGFEYNYTYAKRFTAESEANHISSPSVNWDRRAWDLPYQSLGTWKSAAEFKTLLLAQKSSLAAKTGLAKTMWLLGNWNEFGEGHFIMPTVGLGYRYLDVIREVFGDASPHTDVWPTTEQKARINVLYPQPRILVHPTDRKAVLGTSTSFTVKAVGFPPLTYQWRRNGVDIPGATNTWCSFGPALPENHRSHFSVAISNGMGLVVSNSALLDTVKDSPVRRMPISFPAYNRNETLINFPVLVKLSPALITGFSFSQFSSPNGYDLRFTDAGGTRELNYEVELWDPAHNEAILWVQVPQLKSDTMIWAKWGDFALDHTPFASVTNGATWDASYKGVWHMQEGSGKIMEDATIYRNNAALWGSTSWSQGHVGKAISLNGTTDFALAGESSSSLSLTNSLTLSAWIKPTSFHTSGSYGLMNGIISRGVYSATTLNYALQAKSATTMRFVKRTGTESLKFIDFTGPDYTADWAYVTLSVSGPNATLYVNGQSWGTKTVGTIGPGASDTLYLGGIIPNQPETFFAGALDEIRIRSIAESPNHVWANWMNQTSNSVFVTLGAVTKESDHAIANPGTYIRISSALVSGGSANHD